MNDYIYILKRAFKCGIGVLVFLALVQPFGIGRLNEGRMGYILICSLISFLAVLFSLLLTKAALGDYEKRNGSLKYFLVRESVAYIVNTPILALLLLMYDGWFCQRRWDMFFYEDGHFTLYNVWLMCVNVGIVTVFMFLWAFYEFRNDQLRRELDDVKAINSLLEKRQEELFQRDDKHEEVEEKPVTVVIEGQGQGARLEVMRAPVTVSSSSTLLSALITTFPISGFVHRRYIVRKPIYDILARTVCASQGTVNEPFSLLTPPVMKAESVGLRSETLAKARGCPFVSTICPTYLIEAFCTHSTNISLSCTAMLIG